MTLNLFSPTDEEIQQLEDYLFESDPILQELQTIREIEMYMEFPELAS